MLANPPEKVKEVFKKVNPNIYVTSWAVKFTANLEGVITVLSGMSNIEQMEEKKSQIKNEF